MPGERIDGGGEVKQLADRANGLLSGLRFINNWQLKGAKSDMAAFSNVSCPPCRSINQFADDLIGRRELALRGYRNDE